jgi:hypothetical protein
MHIDRTYDIFKKTSNKDDVWIEAIQGLQQAKSASCTTEPPQLVNILFLI